MTYGSKYPVPKKEKNNRAKEINNKGKVRIALDAMGGDHAPEEILKGAVEAAHDDGLEIVLVGREEIITPFLGKFGHKDLSLSVINASQVVDFNDHPAKAVREKQDSSIVVGMNLIKKGEASAFISAGHSGAVACAALLILGRIPGIERPTLSVLYPTPKGPVLLLDVGANVDCRPSFLVQFAQIGSIYMERVVGIERPRVGLLNIGSEETKGNRLVRQAYALLKNTNLNFVGNVEGIDIGRGVADVIVTDGFTGNVIIKSNEGFAESLYQSLSLSLSRRRRLKVVKPLLAPVLKAFAKRADYREFGGAPLLGVRGNVFIAHGRSQAKAIINAIRLAKSTVERDVLTAMKGEKYG